MRKDILSILLMAFLIFSTDSYAIEEGDECPAISGITFKGEEIDLSNYEGKVILVDFWASWCGPCRIAMPFMAEMYEKYKDNSFVVIAINLDKKKKNAEHYLKKLDSKINFPIIWDKEAKYPEIFQIEAMPTSFLIDREGKIHYIHSGFTGADKEEYEEKIKSLIES